MTLGWLALLPPQSNAILSETQIAQLEDLRRNNAVFHENMATYIRSSPVYIQMVLDCAFGEIKTSYPVVSKSELFNDLCIDLCNCIVDLGSDTFSSDPHRIGETIDRILLGENGEIDCQNRMASSSKMLLYQT